MDNPVVLRQTGAVLIPAAVWTLCAWAAVDAAGEGSVRYALRVGALMSVIAWSAWQLLASPCLVVHPGGLRVVNPMRVHEIPFGALLEVRVRGLTSFRVRQRSGRTRVITSWNAPGLSRRPSSRTIPVAAVIERFHGSWTGTHPDDGTAVVATSWRWRSTLVLICLALANVSS